MLLDILGILMALLMCWLIAKFCKKHNIDIPDSDFHPEWYND